MARVRVLPPGWGLRLLPGLSAYVSIPSRIPGPVVFRFPKLVRGKNARSFPLGYSPSLDGARGLMTVGVLAAHLQYSWYPGAIVFMDTFFVMSSYLITSLLLKDYTSGARVNFRRFYARRARRLLPCLLVMLLVYTAVAALLRRPWEAELKAIAAALFYYMNWARAFDWPMSISLGHTWSLAIEEQFYIVWPLLFALVMYLRSLKVMVIASLIAGAALSAAWRLALAEDGATFNRLYNATDVRLDGLSLGAALAFAIRGRHGGFPARLRRAFDWLTPTAGGILFVAGFSVSYYDRSWYLWQSQVCVVLSTLLVAGLVISPRTLLHPLLESAPAVFLGKICYGLYVWHFPVFFTMEHHLGIDLPVRVAVGLPLLLLIATLSYNLIELPFISREPRATARGGIQTPEPSAAH